MSYKHAGVFEPPPQVVKKIQVVAQRVICGYLLGKIEQHKQKLDAHSAIAADQLAKIDEFEKAVLVKLPRMLPGAALQKQFAKENYLMGLTVERVGDTWHLTSLDHLKREHKSSGGASDITKTIVWLLRANKKVWQDLIAKNKFQAERATEAEPLLHKYARPFFPSAPLIESVSLSEQDLETWSLWRRMKEKTPTLGLPTEYQKIHVAFSFDESNVTEHGFWSNQKKTLKLTVTPPSTANLSKETIVQQVKELLGTVYHETTHLAQYLLKEALATRRAPGNPALLLSTPGYDEIGREPGPEGTEPTLTHALRDVEFYPLLRKNFELFNRMVHQATKGADPPLPFLHKTFSSWVGQHEINALTTNFFRELKEHAPLKWRKAVSEFYKTIEKEYPGF